MNTENARQILTNIKLGGEYSVKEGIIKWGQLDEEYTLYLEQGSILAKITNETALALITETLEDGE